MTSIPVLLPVLPMTTYAKRIDVVETLMHHIKSLDQPSAPGFRKSLDGLFHLDTEASQIVGSRLADLINREFFLEILDERTLVAVQKRADELYWDIQEQGFCCTLPDGSKVTGITAEFQKDGNIKLDVVAEVKVTPPVGTLDSLEASYEPQHRFC